MELTRRPLEVKEDTVSPTTRSAPSPRIEGESLPNDFFKRIVTNSDNLNKKFALSKEDAKLYHKDDEHEPWRVYVGDQKWIDIGLGHALFGIGQQDQLLYQIDDNKNVKRVGSIKRLKEIVEVKDNKVVAVDDSNGAEIYLDGNDWKDWDSSKV